MKRFLIFTVIYLFLLGEGSSNSYFEGKLFVVGDNINVRDLPNINAEIIKTLRISSEVTLLEIKSDLVSVNGVEGKWIYVNTHIYDKKGKDIIKGWVFDYYLAGIDKFKKVTKFRESKINTMVGDTLIYYEFLKDGSYRRKIREIDEYSRVLSVKIEKGHLFRYRDVVLAMDADKQYEVFYITDKGLLCSSVYSNADGFVCSH